MIVVPIINQHAASPPLTARDTAEPKLSGRSVKFVSSDKNLIQRFLHRVSCHTLRHSPSNKTLRLSGREIKFANPTSAIQRLLHRIRCHVSPPNPLDRTRTSDNKGNPCDLAASEAGPPGFDAAQRSALNTIRMSAKKYCGEVVFNFSQLKGAFKQQIYMHSVTRPGVCKSLSDHWMACHANGLSIFDGLYIGGQKGQFNIDALVSIKQLQIDQQSDDTLNAQLNVANDWMTRHGLKLNSNNFHIEDIGRDGVNVFLDCITDRGCYKSIILWRHEGEGYPGFGHAVATYTAKNGEVRFFDPNFGDFKFPNLFAFRNWFEAEFWPRSGYEDTFTGIGALSYTATRAS